MKNLVTCFVVSCFTLAGAALFTADQASAEAEFSWHGQFRINSYTDFRDDAGPDVTGSRLRWRPTVDVVLSDSVSLHTQINIGHINSNIYQSGPTFLRHAVIKADLFDSGVDLMAGLVPISDKFGDTLFSGDWDFNPLAAIIQTSGDFSIRAGAGQFVENDASADDDLTIYLVDADFSPMGIGASVYWLSADSGVTTLGADAGEGDLIIYGAHYSGGSDAFKVDAFIAGSRLDFGAADGEGSVESNGFAGKLAFTIPVDDMSFGVLAIYASGDAGFGSTSSSADAFITPMSLVGSTGYWGKTGKLTEQGPTDTRIDDSTVNIDGGGLPWSSYANLGLGMITIQGSASIPVSETFSAYFGIGHYLSADTPAGQDDYIGTDLYAQGKLNLGQSLSLEFGIDYLAAGEGHYSNIETGNTSSIVTLFSRLQLEY